MWEGLNSAQLESNEINCNNRKEKRSKIQKEKTYGHMSINFSSKCLKKRTKSTIYI